MAWDAPGAGASSDPPDNFTTIDYVHCLAGFLDFVEVAKAHVVGLSWGGILAQEFYRFHPNRLRTLVLADTYAGWRGSLDEDAWQERLSSCLKGAKERSDVVVSRMLPAMFSPFVSNDTRAEVAAIMREFHPSGFRAMSLSSAETDTTDLLPEIGLPTLLVWGAADARSPLTVARRMHESIPNAELAIIPEAGHLSNMERPVAFNDHVRRFILTHETG